MRYSCAALHHCAMKAVSINSVAHYCMNCAKPMHGALCGALFAEMEDGVSICKEVLSEHGQKLFTSNSAVICAMCIKRLDSSQVRSPAESQLVDIEDDEQDGDYHPHNPGQTDEGDEGDGSPSDLSEDDIEIIALSQPAAASQGLPARVAAS